MEETQNTSIILKKVNKNKAMAIKLSVVSFLTIILLFALLFGYNFLTEREEKLLKQISNLKSENQKILSEIKEINEKYTISTNHIKSWETFFSEKQKNLSGVNPETIKNDIIKIANDNYIWNVNISFSPILSAGDAFERKTINVRSVGVTVNFSTLTDINVYNFIDSLRNGLDGFILITGLDLKMERRIDNAFLEELKKNSKPTALSGILNFRFYGLETKQLWKKYL